MPKAKKIKLYTHHGKYFSIRVEKQRGPVKFFAKSLNAVFALFYYVGLAVVGALKFIKNSGVSLCFNVGSLIIDTALKNFRLAKKDISNTREAWAKRLKILSAPQFAKSLLFYILLAGVGWGILFSLGVFSKALAIKNNVIKTAFLGNSYLSQAKDALAKQDFTEAQDRFTLAYQTFTQGQEEFSQSGQALNQLLNLLPQKQSANGLLQAAALISSAGDDFVSLGTEVKSLQIGPTGISSNGQPAGQVLQNIDDSLSSISGKLGQANSLVANINAGTLPGADQETFVGLQGQLQNAQFALTNFKQLFELAEGLISGNKNVLIVFENNNELRATGGFMGTFGSLDMQDGQINKIKVSSIYDLDGQLTQVIQPPQPILNVSDRWFLRDSNWFADFPSSALKIRDFYEMEGGETPDVIVAMTPNLIIDWLKITGPITLRKYGVTLTADNFVEETQAVSTLSDNSPTNDPKQILADLVPVLLQKISSLDKNSLPQIIQSLQNELNDKQIVIYSRDPNLESQLEAFNWSGSLSNTDRDYLSVVSSNLGGTKTDLEVDQTVNLTTTVQDDGTIEDEVDITRTDKMPDLPDTGNDSFIRVYVPQGSQLISNIGFDFKDLEYPAGENYQTDPDVLTWEKNLVTDNLTGTMIGQETGKTFFGNWVTLTGGQTKTVKLVYQLPFKLSGIDRYSLLLQKQIGAEDQPFNWTFNFPGRQIAWKNFDTNNLNTDNLSSAIILNKDYFLGMVLLRR